MTRELVVLGTAGQVPTRERNLNGYFLRWDQEGLLFDPGEGTQRQMILAGVRASAITRILVTHFHGDHCFGLPGVLQRMALDRATHPVDLYFPDSGRSFVEALAPPDLDLRLHPVSQAGLVGEGPPFDLYAVALDHRTQTFGWGLQEPDGTRMLPEELAARGIEGPMIGELQRIGELSIDGRTVRLDEVSEPRPGRRFAFVMDTRLCDGAFELAQGADMLVCESTFAHAEEENARQWGHLTAAQAARIAAESGVRLLVLTHFSQRYPDAVVLLDEAAAIFPNSVLAEDLATIAFPPS